MTQEELQSKVNSILVDEFECSADSLKPDALLIDDIGIDSLDFVDIIVAIEDKFGFKPEAADLKQVKTLGDFYAYVAKHV